MLTTEDVEHLHEYCCRLVNAAVNFASTLRIKIERASDGSVPRPNYSVKRWLMQLAKISCPKFNLEEAFNLLASRGRSFAWPNNPPLSAHEFVTRHLSEHLATAMHSSDALAALLRLIYSSWLTEHLHAEYRLMAGITSTVGDQPPELPQPPERRITDSGKGSNDIPSNGSGTAEASVIRTSASLFEEIVGRKPRRKNASPKEDRGNHAGNGNIDMISDLISRTEQDRLEYLAEREGSPLQKEANEVLQHLRWITDKKMIGNRENPANLASRAIESSDA